MTQFPIVDPTPLPAPIWFFKTLLNLTLGLHLASVDLLLGGLVLAIAFALMGRTRAAGMMVHRLPTLMAFVINLGVPPLLFAQVLYGRALPTGSVLIGTYWFGVIVLLAGSYYGLYAAARRADRRRSWIGPGIAALVMVLTIAFIYSNNMTLMLRPQLWPSLSHSNPTGFQLNTGDPTLIARWFFFIAGAFPVAGAALALMALRSGLGESTERFLAQGGGVAMAAGMLMQGTFADLAYDAQPASVMSSVMHNAIYGGSAWGWVISAVLLFVLGLLAVIAASNRTARKTIAMGASFIAMVNVGAVVMVRDGIRDFTLRAQGFEVWDRAVVTNWSTICMFGVLFVAALGVLGYLAKARRAEESYA